MQIMARGSAVLAARLQAEGRFDGVTARWLDGHGPGAGPVWRRRWGVPKYVVSTVSFSPMIPPHRLAPDIQMILWAGGLYGLNSVCKASLSQAAGAVLGAARAVEKPACDRPLIGMTSFGKTVLRYMVTLKPALEAMGFEVAVFHATGMGGRAFEALAAEGAFAAVMDFAPQEVGNHLHGSAISAGPDRMTAAGKAGVPQIVSIGCYDLVDLVGWHPMPGHLRDRPAHAHNRLLTSVVMTPRRAGARWRGRYASGWRGQRGRWQFLPPHGGNEWDREGGPLSDPEGLAAFIDAMAGALPGECAVGGTGRAYQRRGYFTTRPWAWIAGGAPTECWGGPRGIEPLGLPLAPQEQGRCPSGPAGHSPPGYFPEQRRAISGGVQVFEKVKQCFELVMTEFGFELAEDGRAFLGMVGDDFRPASVIVTMVRRRSVSSVSRADGAAFGHDLQDAGQRRQAQAVARSPAGFDRAGRFRREPAAPAISPVDARAVQHFAYGPHDGFARAQKRDGQRAGGAAQRGMCHVPFLRAGGRVSQVTMMESFDRPPDKA
ncbi:MAG: Tm-1-like ATP-binding domain-containing protein [Paracoccaceae bacterium]